MKKYDLGLWKEDSAGPNDTDLYANVADFGLSRKVETSMAGVLPTWRWLAPEVIDVDCKAYTELSDIYSFAIILWEIACLQVSHSTLL